MDTLTYGVQQLLMYTCGSFFLGWFTLTIGQFLGRVLLDRLQDWIE